MTTARCWMCGRPRGPAPDGLGSHCRRKLTTRRSAPADQPTLEDHMPDRFAAEIRIDMHDLTGDDLDEIQSRLASALVEWKPTVTVERTTPA